MAHEKGQSIDLGQLKIARDNAGLIFTRQSPLEFRVPAPSKRRRTIYSLPVVVAVAFLLVAKLALWQRADIISELSDRVTHGDTSDATAAVRQLEAMPRPPLSVLVDAAASADQKIAHDAQLAISRLMRRWQRQLDMKQSERAVARQLGELAQLLAEQRAAFPDADHSWLAGTARKVLRLANRCPVKRTPLVAMHCDAILSAIDSGNVATTPIAGEIEGETGGAPIRETAQPVERSETQDSRQARLERDITAVDSQPGDVNESIELGSDAREPSTSKDRSNNAEAPAADGEQQQIAPGLQSDPEWVEPTLPSERIGDDDEYGSDGNDDTSDELTRRSWQSDWSQPIFRILPAMPINGSPADRRRLNAAALGTRTTSPSLRVVAHRMDTRELLQNWREAQGVKAVAIEEELAARGFKRLSDELVEQYFSSDVRERRQLVNEVLTKPGVDARSWLLLLSDDSDADVRFDAVTIMATSSDPMLIDKAWQVSIADRDPRIAGLAGKLRERRR